MKLPFTIADKLSYCILTNRTIEPGEPVAQSALGLIMPLVLTRPSEPGLHPVVDSMALNYGLAMLTAFAGRQQCPVPEPAQQEHIVLQALTLMMEKIPPGTSIYLHECLETEPGGVGVAEVFWHYLYPSS